MRRRCYNCHVEIYDDYTIYESMTRITCSDCLSLRRELMENMPEEVEPLKPKGDYYFWIFPQEEGMDN